MIKNKKITNFEKKVYNFVKKIPKGKTMTYKEVAVGIGSKKSARAVGNALNKNPFSPKVPCHRVVKSNGEIGGFNKGIKTKIKLLKKEGVIIRKNKIVR